jgi:integrase
VPPLAKSTLSTRAVYLHRLLEELAWSKQIPTHLLSREDVPRRDQILPRALLPEQDQLLQQELRRRDDLLSNLLLLQRHTGMRIGECVDLTADCLRPLGPDQWAIHVPVGKFNKDRLVPVDSFVCHIVERLQSLRSQTDQPPGEFLLPRHRSRETLIRRVRAAFHAAATAVGITAKLVPHQARHTYASEMLRAGVSLIGDMKLLGHSRPEMTMQYLKITLQDLQHESKGARQFSASCPLSVERAGPLAWRFNSTPRHSHVPRQERPRHIYSWRSADIGSILAADLAGRYPARIATTPSAAAATETVTGSRGSV